jgi:phosphatidylglycerol---prolipoprotein diacylglyceryl transferase
MNPIAFDLLGISIRWYAILIAIGLLIGIGLAKINSKYRSIDYDMLMDITFMILPIAIIGARLYYVAFEFNNYKDNLIEIFNIRQGGLAIHGGILFAVVAGWIIARKKKFPLLKALDVVAPSMILAQALGRWGNFYNGEAFGGQVSYEFIKHFPVFIQQGMHINGVYYQPTFLYESIWNLLVFVILMILLRKNKRTGIVAFSYLGLYSIGRFFIEGMRTDSLMFGTLRIAQLVSVVGIVMWMGFLIYPLLDKVIKKYKLIRKSESDP